MGGASISARNGAVFNADGTGITLDGDNDYLVIQDSILGGVLLLSQLDMTFEFWVQWDNVGYASTVVCVVVMCADSVTLHSLSETHCLISQRIPVDESGCHSTL